MKRFDRSGTFVRQICESTSVRFWRVWLWVAVWDSSPLSQARIAHTCSSNFARGFPRLACARSLLFAPLPPRLYPSALPHCAAWFLYADHRKPGPSGATAKPSTQPSGPVFIIIIIVILLPLACTHRDSALNRAPCCTPQGPPAKGEHNRDPRAASPLVKGSPPARCSTGPRPACRASTNEPQHAHWRATRTHPQPGHAQTAREDEHFKTFTVNVDLHVHVPERAAVVAVVAVLCAWVATRLAWVCPVRTGKRRPAATVARVPATAKGFNAPRTHETHETHERARPRAPAASPELCRAKTSSGPTGSDQRGGSANLHSGATSQEVLTQQ